MNESPPRLNTNKVDKHEKRYPPAVMVLTTDDGQLQLLPDMMAHYMACKLDKVCQLHADYGSKCPACAKLACAAYKQATEQLAGNTAGLDAAFTTHLLHSIVYTS